MVADAPAFADIWPELSSFIGDAVVIGHALGFDLAVLKRECERAGIDWARPRTLDTRLLAEVAEPDLAGYSLDSLAAWLGCRNHRSPFRAWRRTCLCTDFPRTAAEAARRRNPNAGRSRASLSRPDRCARPAASRRLGGGSRSAERAPIPNARYGGSTAILIVTAFATLCARRCNSLQPINRFEKRWRG